MRYFFDLPEATVAGELQITVGTVKSTSARALAKLRISPDRISPDPGRQVPPATGPVTIQASAMDRP